MFGKKSGFKYEVEVNALIKDATDNLHIRILELEMQNQQLHKKNQMLECLLVENVQKLEKRITDFTDIWHPIMMENINRIKAELETTVKSVERESINEIKHELETKLSNMIIYYDNEKMLRHYAGLPEYMGSKVKLSELVAKINEYYSSGCAAADGNNYCKFKFSSPYTDGIHIIDNNNNIIVEGSVKGIGYERWSHVECVVSDGFNSMYNYFKEHCEPVGQDIDNWLNSMFRYSVYGGYGVPIPHNTGSGWTTQSRDLCGVLKPDNRKKIIDWLKNGKGYDVLSTLKF